MQSDRVKFRQTQEDCVKLKIDLNGNCQDNEIHGVNDSLTTDHTDIHRNIHNPSGETICKCVFFFSLLCIHIDISFCRLLSRLLNEGQIQYKV